MSMTGNLARITQKQYDELHRNPTGITSFLAPEAPPTPHPLPRTVLGGLWARIRSGNPDGRECRLVDEDRVNLDKSWHALHFLLTGTSWEGTFPAGFLVSTGRPVGIVDVGYGPARSFSVAEVTELAAFLRNLDENHLRSRFNPQSLAEQDIYPSGWTRSPDIDQEWLYIREVFRRMRSFILEAAHRKMALLVYII